MVKKLFIACILFTPIACLHAADNKLFDELPDITDAVFQGPRVPTPTGAIIPQNITPETAAHALDMLSGDDALEKLEYQAARQTAELGISFMGIPGMTAEKYEQLMQHAEGMKHLLGMLENEMARLSDKKADLLKKIAEEPGS